MPLLCISREEKPYYYQIQARLCTQRRRISRNPSLPSCSNG